ncbi:MAG: 23S rRNA (uracil(1939)-C(5))-methyltransferase RlmD [Terracidiphilus sp.]|jgi:23S rRNA (uracil1939-C5)-methyltransferase
MKKWARGSEKRDSQGLKPSPSAGGAARLKSCPDKKPAYATESAVPAQLVQIEKPVYGGTFLARVEGKAVFVPLALPGERVRVRVAEEKPGYATAEVEEIVAAAADRVTPACRHFGVCGGCQYQHAGYAAQIALKLDILRESLERGSVRAPAEIEVLAGEPWAYRNRIRVAFDAEGRVGYRGRRSHAVVSIEECPIAAPLLVRAAMAAGESVRGLAVHERPNEVSLFCDAEETSLLASATVADRRNRGLEAFARALAEKIPETKGVEYATPGGKGREAQSVGRWGESSLHYCVAGFAYRVDQGAFFQANRWLVDALVERVTGKRSGGLAWDLFAGVGLFARRCAERFERVAAVEVAPAATRALKENLRGTGAVAVKAATLEFLRRARKEQRPELIVVDPPRTGLGAETTALLGQIGAPEMVYVSCDPATLARDLRALVGAGYDLCRVTLVDLFPQTFHLETVAELRRR